MLCSCKAAQQYTKMKQAQIKMLTTIAVLVVFFIILMFGFIFYTQIERIGLEKSQIEAEARRSIAVAQVVSNLPELQCSIGAVEKGVCFDLYKIKAFKAVSPGYYLHYYNMFGYATIDVKLINLTGGTDVTHSLYNNTGNKRSFTAGHIPISIYDATNKEFSFGVVEVNSYYG